MRMTRQAVLARLYRNIRQGKPVLGVSVGAGISARHAAQGGADMLLALNSGRFRQMGFSSLAGMLPYGNSNEMVMRFGSREVLRVVEDVPVIFGMCASDPMINRESFIDRIYEAGFSGINNFPTVGIIDGTFRQALEETGMGYAHEVLTIAAARKRNIFTVAFVFDRGQAALMTDAGADVICVHLGFTRGGMMGVKSYLPLEDASRRAQEIFSEVDRLGGKGIKMIYGGPVKTPRDAEFIYNNTDAAGYIGGSSFERIPTEEAIIHTVDEFKRHTRASAPGGEGDKKHIYTEFIRAYVARHYAEKILFSFIAEELHLSRTYLSALFTKEVGCSFQEFLTQYRIKKARELMGNEGFAVCEIAERVGFSDPAYFSKTFKRHTGQSPSVYIRESSD